MRFLIIFHFFFLFIKICFCQKPLIDTSCFNKWPLIGQSGISNDGKYIFYFVFNQPIGNKTLIVKSLKTDWSRELIGAKNPIFSQDSRKLVCILPQDTLIVIELASANDQVIFAVKSFELLNKGSPNNLLICGIKDSLNSLAVCNLNNGKLKLYPFAQNYTISEDGKEMAFLAKISLKNDQQLFRLINLDNDKISTICDGCKVNSYKFDNTHGGIVYIKNEESGNQLFHSIWHYKVSDEHAIRLAFDSSLNWGPGYFFNSIARVSKDGERVFVVVRKIGGIRYRSDFARVDIWTYLDPVIPTSRLVDQSQIRSYTDYLAVLDIVTGSVKRLELTNQKVVFPEDDLGQDLWLLLIEKGYGGNDERNWNSLSFCKLFLISTLTGEKKLIPFSPGQSFAQYSLSRYGKYVLFYLAEKRAFFCYNVTANKFINITHGIKAKWASYEDQDLPTGKTLMEHLPIWLHNDSAVLIYDQNDLWIVDPEGIKGPINVSRNYGKEHDISFKVSFNFRGKSDIGDSVIIVKGFKRGTKEDGFYKVFLKGEFAPEVLSCGKFIYGGSLDGTDVKKARDTSLFIVQRMSDTEAPNYFLTTDFRVFRSISQIAPQHKYNWYKAELFHWKTFDGHISDGILYKPENFDSTKKYPLIFYVYERFSNNTYNFMMPGINGGTIDIPYYTSNGYLIFCPDIYYSIGHPGASAYNYIESAAVQIGKLSFVDRNRIGIQGHSFGGFEVNYMITHSHLFRAALSAAGVCNFIDLYGDLIHGESYQSMLETGQSRIGTTLWNRPDLYSLNSPIFRANRVTTPVLIMHNKLDVNVPFHQGLQFFLALRRLGKRAWLLQYGGQSEHMVNGQMELLDYFVRTRQFFDHYLKDCKAPKWMTRGLFSYENSVDAGLEYDDEILTPGLGLVRPARKLR